MKVLCMIVQRKINKLKSFYLSMVKKLRSKTNHLRHLLWCWIKNRNENHVVLCGFSRAGTTMVYNMLRSVSPNDVIKTIDKELGALNTYDMFSEYLITKRQLDVFKIDEIEKKIGSFKKTKYIFIIEDPRDCISSFHSSVNNQFFQNIDYQFYVNRNAGVASLTYPGISSITKEIFKFKRKYPNKVMVLKYEDFLDDLEQQEIRIKEFTNFPFSGKMRDFYKTDIPSELSIQLNGIRPVQKKDKPSWLEEKRLERVLRSYQVFPEIDDLCTSLGYESLDRILNSYSIEKKEYKKEMGTIVAFHTEDKIYTDEATRFKARVNELNLPLYVESIKSGNNWVENCAKKSQFLYEMRSKIRGPLLYADVDSFLHKDPWPYFLLYDCDIAAYISKDGELLSGTLFINDTQGAFNCLKEWSDRQVLNSNVWDQQVLQEIIDEEEAKPESERTFVFNRLPVSMCKIFDKNIDNTVEPYFEHLQVSRERKWGENSMSVKNRRRRISELWSKR